MARTFRGGFGLLIRVGCGMSPMTVSQASASESRATSDALLYILCAGSTPSAQVPMAGRSCTRSRGGTIPHVVDSVSNEGPRGSATRVLTCACRCVRLMPGSALRPLCMLCAGFGSLCKCFSALHKLLSFAGPCWQILLPDWRIARRGRAKTEYNYKNSCTRYWIRVTK